MTRFTPTTAAGRGALASGLLAGMLALPGCGAEGEGTIQPAGPPPTEDALGRPFGNAPAGPTKKTPATRSKKAVPEAVNPKLRG
jgi:hypothetical protein